MLDLEFCGRKYMNNKKIGVNLPMKIILDYLFLFLKEIIKKCLNQILFLQINLDKQHKYIMEL